MQAAAGNLISELTLIGFIALLLIVLQNPIHSICGTFDMRQAMSHLLTETIPRCRMSSFFQRVKCICKAHHEHLKSILSSSMQRWAPSA